MEFSGLLNMCRLEKPGIKTDSRKVEPGDIFVAVHGEDKDGGEFISQAAKNGARYIVCAPDRVEEAAKNFPSVDITPHSDQREAVWRLAQARYDTDKTPMKIIGITGTNGKTTSAWLLEHLFASAGYATGMLGTISYRWPGFSMPAPLTTPGPLDLHEMLAKMANAGAQIAIMEVSSHALAQQRVCGINFDGAIFTNLTQDHLDFHKDMESYFQAKSKLFSDLPRKDKAMAINADEEHGRRLLEILPHALAFGLGERGSGENFLRGEILKSGISGSNILMDMNGLKWELHSHLVGEFNIYNLLGVQALALAMGLRPENMRALESFAGVPGRLERVLNPRGLHIFVDYAHTPDALENALKALRGAGFKKIVTVFGCGGNRDRTKRPLMGEKVARFSDVAVLTSDNPRFENPDAIIDDVKPGLKTAEKVIVEADRRKATEIAINLLGDGDCLLIAGKGHEDYQIFGAEKRHYSDQETAREILNCA